MIVERPFPLPVFAPSDTRPGTPEISPEELQRRTAVSREFSARLGEIVGLMIRSRSHSFALIAELEWLLLPAIAARQIRVVEGISQESGFAAPVAAILWASVSPEIDQRLSQNLDQPIRLRPPEWRSGEIVWIVEAIGEPRAVTAALQHLKQNELKDRTVRMRVNGADGKPGVGRLELQAAEPKSPN